MWTPEQYEHLKAFRSKCQSRGLYETYESLSEFREKLSRQLTITMIRRTAGSPQIAVELARNAQEALARRSAPATGKSLSQTTKELLKSMSQDRNGTLLRVDVIRGAILQTNGRQLNVQGDARDIARWDAAIEELERAGLVTAAGYKREIFKLTNDGYDQADGIAI